MFLLRKTCIAEGGAGSRAGFWHLKSQGVVGALGGRGGGCNGDGVFHSFVGGLRRQEYQNRESVALFIVLNVDSFRIMYINLF